ncbi:MAG: response regulator transcription factor [Acidimicrobiia bacterium]|nr:response regulator transcription factor [Acidimicrobiia bacterium]
MTTTVVLAEDSYLMREALVALLGTLDDVDLIAACETYDQLIETVEQLRPAVVITDIRMPPTQTDEGIRAANHIREHYPDTGVVVLSQYVEPEYALRLFRDGSAGRAYLLKDHVGDIDVLSAAMAEVMKGGSIVDPQVVEVLVAARVREKESLLRRLSPRELEVLAEMAKGLNNAGMAKALFISPRAVEKHINAIFTKLDLSFEEAIHRRVRAVLLYLAETND